MYLGTYIFVYIHLYSQYLLFDYQRLKSACVCIHTCIYKYIHTCIYKYVSRYIYI